AAFLANKYLIAPIGTETADSPASASADVDAATSGREVDGGAQEAASVAAQAGANDEDAPGAAEPPVTPGEKAAAEAVPAADVATDLQQEAGVEPKLAAEQTVKISGEDVSKMLPSETVQLGD